jgi:hypothetical protein
MLLLLPAASKLVTRQRVGNIVVFQTQFPLPIELSVGFFLGNFMDLLLQSAQVTTCICSWRAIGLAARRVMHA